MKALATRIVVPLLTICRLHTMAKPLLTCGPGYTVVHRPRRRIYAFWLVRNVVLWEIMSSHWLTRFRGFSSSKSSRCKNLRHHRISRYAMNWNGVSSIFTVPYMQAYIIICLAFLIHFTICWCAFKLEESFLCSFVFLLLESPWSKRTRVAWLLRLDETKQSACFIWIATNY